jgi:hypothetical protein
MYPSSTSVALKARGGPATPPGVAPGVFIADATG